MLSILACGIRDFRFVEHGLRVSSGASPPTRTILRSVTGVTSGRWTDVYQSPRTSQEASMSIACTQVLPETIRSATSPRTGTAPTDQALIERVAKGDQAALRTLANRHYGRILRF